MPARLAEVVIKCLKRGDHVGDLDREQLGEQLEAAGFAGVTVQHSYDLEKDGHAYPLFLAITTR